MSNILIIEDDVYLAEDLKFFIEDVGHSCQIYTRADQVMDNINGLGEFDWIILDIMMLKGEKIDGSDPDVETGEVIYRHIRAKYPKTKIFILSAKDFSDMRIDFHKEPHVKLMQKPVTEEKLKELLLTLSG